MAENEKIAYCFISLLSVNLNLAAKISGISLLIYHCSC